MGTPANKRDAIADLGGLLVPAHIRHHFPVSSRMLDVGAGWGKYQYLLPEYPMDACEIWEPYIEENGLKTKYREVFNIDICEFEYKWYDVIIFGDVLEHIDKQQAEKVLFYANAHCTQFYIVVPYSYPQEAVDGNPYEAHQQSDLTDEIMHDRFHVSLLARDENKGVYIK